MSINSETKDQIKDRLAKLETPGRRSVKSIDKEIRLDINHLNPSIFKDMIVYYDNILSSPIEYIVTSLLTGLSGVIGKRAYIEFDHIRVYFNVWSVIIGKSSTMKKTTCINRVLRDLEDINARLYQDYNSKKMLYDAVPEGNNKPEREYIIYPDDITIEKLLEKIANQSKGIFRYSEFGQFLKQFNKGYAGDFKQFLTHIYDVPKQYEYDRISREGKFIERPYISILGASTIEWFKAGLENADVSSGFLARFLFSIRNVNDKEFISLFDLQDRNLPLQSKHIDTYKIFNRLNESITVDTKLTFDKDAIGLMKMHEIRINQRADNIITSNDESSYLTRLSTYCFKISGIIALTNKRTNITKEDVQDAITLCNYYEKNISFLLDDQLKTNRHTAKETEIYEFICRQENKTASRSLIMNKCRLTSKEFEGYLETLKDKDLVTDYFRKNQNARKETQYIQAIS